MLLTAYAMLGIALVAIPSFSRAGSTGGDGTIERFRRQAWWLPRYSSLASKLDGLPGRTWGFALNRPDPEDQGSMKLSREGDQSMLVLSQYKQQAIDPRTEQPIPGLLIDVVMKILDTNLDGIPDEFRGEPFHPIPGETVLANHFIKIL